jgi:hypothetical protein
MSSGLGLAASGLQPSFIIGMDIESLKGARKTWIQNQRMEQ